MGSISGIGLNFGKGDNGYYTTKRGKKLILDNLKAIILTNPGERVHLPTFGVGIKRFVFDQNDETLTNLIESAIKEQIALWEPGVDVTSVKFKIENEQVNVQLTAKLNELSGESVEVTLTL